LASLQFKQLRRRLRTAPGRSDARVVAFVATVLSVGATLIGIGHDAAGNIYVLSSLIGRNQVVTIGTMRLDSNAAGMRIWRATSSFYNP
jgi:hypothetical protein